MKTISDMNNNNDFHPSHRKLPGLRIYQILMMAALLFIAVSCKDDDDTDPTIEFAATLSGANEVPPNASTATGSATLTFNENTKMFTVIVTFTGLTPSAAHIHLGAAGTPGNVVFGFPPPIATPINYTSVPLDAAQEADLKAGLYYVNIHTTAYQGGEIRGQLELVTD
jgi:hypothetical protein